MTARPQACGRCGGTLDARSGVCQRCGFAGFDLRVLAAAPLAGALLGALGTREIAIAVAWIGVMSLAAFVSWIRGRSQLPAAQVALPWLAACGGSLGASLATLLPGARSGAPYRRAQIRLIATLHLVALLVTYVAWGGWRT